MEPTVTIATLALTGLLTLERLFKNCAPNFFQCTGLRHADFECAKCLSASLDYANTPATSPSPLSRPQSNEIKETQAHAAHAAHAAHETRRLSLDELREILEEPTVKDRV